MIITKVGKNQNKITGINAEGNPAKFKAAHWDGCSKCAFVEGDCPVTDQSTEWKGVLGQAGSALCSPSTRIDRVNIIWVEVSDENVGGE